MLGRRSPTIEHYLLKNLKKKIPDNQRILDVGAGEQPYRKYCSHLNYVSQDFGEYDGTGNGEGLQMGTWNQSNLDIISDICSIPEPNASFDVIMCTEVFEHIPDPLSALNEFSRLLRSGGLLILTAPLMSRTHFAPYHFCSGFSRYFWEKHLPENGFEIQELETNGNYFEWVGYETYNHFNVSKRYTGKYPSPLDFLCMYGVLRFCRKMSKRDKGSAEYLCFGHHILAVKR